MLDDISLYWFTNSPRHHRIYWENAPARQASGGRIELPMAASVFPHEIFCPPKALVTSPRSSNKLFTERRVAEGLQVTARFESCQDAKAALAGAFSSIVWMTQWRRAVIDPLPGERVSREHHLDARWDLFGRLGDGGVVRADRTGAATLFVAPGASSWVDRGVSPTRLRVPLGLLQRSERSEPLRRERIRLRAEGV
jgi:hypothetical protein